MTATRHAERRGIVSTPYMEDIDPAIFPRAASFREWIDATGPALHEGTRPRNAFPYSERHLHCLWHDPALRPAQLKTRAGEIAHVESPGVWNREAGPDFLGAVVRIGPAQRRMAGDVEIHIHPADWSAHGHADDARYAGVRFHVTYFPGAPDDWPRVPGAVHIVLKDAVTAIPGFHFEHIDTTAYPYAARSDTPPCAVAIQACAPDARLEILRAAGEERLRRKAQRMRQLVTEVGPGQALYEETCSALGYKHNKAAFRQVARSLPLEEWRDLSGGDILTAYALFMGVAGLLPEGARGDWGADTRQWIRSLWDRWWRYRDQFANRQPSPVWRLDDLRPANHPARRAMAAARLFMQEPYWEKMLPDRASRSPDTWVQETMKHLAALQDPYLSMRGSLTGAPRRNATALIGPARAAALCTNVWVPYCAAVGVPPAALQPALSQLPAEPDNGIIKQTAYYLFGRDHSPALYRTATARQGLLQIFHDFCLNDRSRCARCIFPTAIERYRNGREQ